MDKEKFIEVTFECPDVDCRKVFTADVYNPKYIGKLESKISALKQELREAYIIIYETHSEIDSDGRVICRHCWADIEMKETHSPDCSLLKAQKYLQENPT